MYYKLFGFLKIIRLILVVTLLLTGLCISLITYAARPMFTDDARIVDAKSCQLETWIKSNRDSTEYWALPACNFTGNLELTLGGAITKDNSVTNITDLVFQGKTLFKVLKPNSWSWGVTLGNNPHPYIPAARFPIGDLYAYLPASFSFRDNNFVLHTNLGLLYNKENKHLRITWGVGSETQLSKNLWLIAEAFVQDQSKPLYQAGFRYWIIPSRLQIDTTYGNRFSNNMNERWFSIGLRLLSKPFLP